MRLVLTISVVASLLIGAAPAANADDVDGVVRVSVTSTGTGGFKTATASCPIGKRLMGGGWEIAELTSSAVIDDMLPNTNLTTMAGTAYGPGGSWPLTTYGICAQSQPGMQRYAADSAGDGGAESATVTCPGAKVLVGSGFRISGAEGEAKVHRLRPNGSESTAPTSVTVAADGPASPYTVTAYADCADPSEGLVPGLKRRTTSSVTSPFNKTNVNLTCAQGEVLLSAGFDIVGAVGVAAVNDLRPNGNTSTAPTMVTLNVYETQEHNDNWYLTVYGVCAVAG